MGHWAKKFPLLKEKSKKPTKKSKKIWVKKDQSKDTLADYIELVPPKDPALLINTSSLEGVKRDLSNESTGVIVEASSLSKKQDSLVLSKVDHKEVAGLVPCLDLAGDKNIIKDAMVTDVVSFPTEKQAQRVTSSLSLDDVNVAKVVGMDVGLLQASLVLPDISKEIGGISNLMILEGEHS